MVDAAELPEWQIAKRDSIIAAASRLLEQRPFEAILIREVAEAAGVALGTLYRYFRSKEQVYAGVLGAWGSWDNNPSGVFGATPGDRLRSRVSVIVDAVEDRPYFFTMELALQSTTDEAARAMQRDWSNAGAIWLAQDLASLESLEARRVSVMLWAIINDVLKRATLHGEPFEEARATANAFIDLIVDRL